MNSTSSGEVIFEGNRKEEPGTPAQGDGLRESDEDRNAEHGASGDQLQENHRGSSVGDKKSK